MGSQPASQTTLEDKTKIKDKTTLEETPDPDKTPSPAALLALSTRQPCSSKPKLCSLIWSCRAPLGIDKNRAGLHMQAMGGGGGGEKRGCIVGSCVRFEGCQDIKCRQGRGGGENGPGMDDLVSSQPISPPPPSLPVLVYTRREEKKKKRRDKTKK